MTPAGLEGSVVRVDGVSQVAALRDAGARRPGAGGRPTGEPVVRAAAVQWARRPFATAQALEGSLGAAVSEAVAAGAGLVVFPAGVGEALAEATGATGPALAQAFESLGRSLARAHRVTLALGPVTVPVAGGAQRVAHLFGPEGQVLGAQAQTHRGPVERAQGLVRGTTLAPIQTPAGAVGLLSGADVEYPEVSRILCLQGATILVHQGALAAWSEALALARLWREVQANQVFGVEAYAVGQGWRGRSAIHAPVEMAPDGSGWLARAPHADRPALVVADLDAAALAGVVGRYPIHALRNMAQYRRYFPALYQAEAGSGRA